MVDTVPPVTQVTLTVDQHTLTTLRAALAALQLAAATADAIIVKQVEAQLAPAKPPEPPT